MGEHPRKALRRCRRLVVKIGSQALGDPRMFSRLAKQIAAVMHDGKRPRGVVLVSSGAIALGMGTLGMARRPRKMASLQAVAAAGQGLLMQRYGKALSRYDIPVAQVLLTHADLASRDRANNARAALTKLLELGALPIINENDAVAVDEIRFGDNDELAAMVTPLCGADLLLLLSHVDGVLDDGVRVPVIERVDSSIEELITASTSDVGRGGMRSKLEAARRATLAGAHVVIASARTSRVIGRVLAGEDVGTLLPAVPQRLTLRKHWIAYTLRPHGAAVIDAGAEKAIVGEGRSVLCVGVVGIRGAFVQGQPIRIVTMSGREVARGLTRLSATDAARLAGARSDQEPTILVHRDDLVLLPTV